MACHLTFKSYLKRIPDLGVRKILSAAWVKSRRHRRQGEYEECFECYEFLLENCPNVSYYIQMDVAILLKNWGSKVCERKLEKDGDDISNCHGNRLENKKKEKVETISDDNDTESLKKILNAHAVAVRFCHQPEVFFNSCGIILYRLNRLLEAREYFEESLKLKPSDASVRENLDNLNSLLVDRWHFPMLNDCTRNSRFEASILNAMSLMKVEDSERFACLDVGAGTGLLSMYMVRGAQRSNTLRLQENFFIIACELDECMHRIATEILEKNSMKEINLIHSSSNSIFSPLPGCPPDVKLKMVVTETFDAGLLGEGVLESLDHVYRNLNIDENLIVLPRSATLYFCLFESTHIRQYSSYNGNADHINTDNIKIFSNVAFPSDRRQGKSSLQPYTCEKMSSLRNGYRMLSDPVAVETICFESAESVSTHLSGVMKQLTVQVTRSGVLDALVLWFDLHLDDSNQLTTSPLTLEGQSSCWQQVVYPVYDVDGEGLTLDASHLVTVECTIKGLVHLKLKKITRTNDDSQSSLPQSSSSPGSTFSPLSLPPPSILHPKTPTEIFLLPPSTISLLNDSPYHRECLKSLNSVLTLMDFELLHSGVAIISGVKDGSGVFVALESCRRRLFVKFLLPSLGESSFRNYDDGVNEDEEVKNDGEKMVSSFGDSVFCEVVQMMKKIVEDNGSEWSKITFKQMSIMKCDDDDDEEDKKEEEDDNHLDDDEDIHGEDVRMGSDDNDGDDEGGQDDDLKMQFSTNESSPVSHWLVGFVDLVDASGSIRSNVLRDVFYAKSAFFSLGHVIIPNRVHCMAVLIDSSSLSADSSVLHSTDPFEVASVMNKFKTTYHCNFYLQSLRHTKVTAPFQLFTYEMNQPATTSSQSAFCNKSCHHIVQSLTQARVMALVYWFRIELVSGGMVIDTSSSEGHWKQSAIHVAEPFEVAAGDTIEVKVKCVSGYFSADIYKNKKKERG